jgi:integrase
MAVRDGLLLRNPAEGIKTPPVRSRPQRFLEAVDVSTPAAAAEERMSGTGLVVETLAYVGLRWSELVALRRSRVDVLRRRIEVAEAATELSVALSWGPPKSHEPRIVTMPTMLVDKLAAHLGSVETDGHVLTAQRGGPLRSSVWRRNVWIPALDHAGTAGLRIHDLRHTAASLMISSGASIEAVQRQLDHASATMTLDLCGHLYDDDLGAPRRRPRSQARRISRAPSAPRAAAGTSCRCRRPG